jgi:hypothetical protein
MIDFDLTLPGLTTLEGLIRVKPDSIRRICQRLKREKCKMSNDEFPTPNEG